MEQLAGVNTRLLGVNQQDFDEAVKRLPSPTEIDVDIYIIPSINTGCRFVFRKKPFYIIPQGEKLVMWVLKEILYLEKIKNWKNQGKMS